MKSLNRLAAWATLVAVVLVGSAFLPASAPSLERARLRVVPTLFAQPSAASVRLTAPYRVTVGGTAGQITASGNVHGVVIKALCPGQTIYIGVASSVTTLTGYPMVDGETLTLEVRNADQLYAIASAAAQSVAVLPFSRY